MDEPEVIQPVQRPAQVGGLDLHPPQFFRFTEDLEESRAVTDLANGRQDELFEFRR